MCNGNVDVTDWILFVYRIVYSRVVVFECIVPNAVGPVQVYCLAPLGLTGARAQGALHSRFSHVDEQADSLATVTSTIFSATFSFIFLLPLLCNLNCVVYLLLLYLQINL